MQPADLLRRPSVRAQGTLQILLSGAGFGLLGIFGKWAYASGVSPDELLALRFLIASITMGLGLLLVRPRAFRLTLKQIASCSALGILGYAVFASCYFHALQGLSASLTVLLLYLYPVMVVVGARFCFGERLQSRALVALPLVTGGLLLLLHSDLAIHQALSLIFGVGSAVFYALYILASSRLLRSIDPISAAFYIQLSAAIVLTAISFHNASGLDGARMITLMTKAWRPVLGLAWVSTAVPITLFLSGLKKLTHAETSILSTSEPFTAIIAASLLLNEKMSPPQWIGAFIVVGSFIFLSLPERKSLASLATETIQN